MSEETKTNESDPEVVDDKKTNAEETREVSETIPFSKSSKIRSLFRTPIFFMIVIPILLLVLAFVFGELHGTIPVSIQNGLASSKDGYKVIYGFDFIPSLFKFIGTDIRLSFMAVSALVLLACTPILVACFNFFSKRKELENTRLKNQQVHDIEMKNLELQEKELESGARLRSRASPP